MKTIFTSLLVFAAGVSIKAQTLTYANFSTSLTQTLEVKIADNSSYNSSLSTTTGNGVTWNASGLTQKSGTPLVHLSYHAPSSTPKGSLYPNSNYCEYDPDLTAAIEYKYYGISADSMVVWGGYAPDHEHEIYQDPDKHLVFPMAFGESFTDPYAKTNYSDATTISSYQTGARTVTFAGYGTLTLPQGTFTGIGLFTEVRTNSLGPDSYYYNWVRLSDGKRMLFRSENDGSITTVYSTEMSTGLGEEVSTSNVSVWPNPVNIQAPYLNLQSNVSLVQSVFTLRDVAGKIVYQTTVTGNRLELPQDIKFDGLYVYSLTMLDQTLVTGKIFIH